MAREKLYASTPPGSAMSEEVKKGGKDIQERKGGQLSKRKVPRTRK